LGQRYRTNFLLVNRNNSQFAFILAGVLMVHLAAATALMKSAQNGGTVTLGKPYLFSAPEAEPRELLPSPPHVPMPATVPVLVIENPTPVPGATVAAKAVDSGLALKPQFEPDPPQPRLESLLDRESVNPPKDVVAVRSESLQVETPLPAARVVSEPVTEEPAKNPNPPVRLRKVRALPTP
jgi:hypothetical protein